MGVLTSLVHDLVKRRDATDQPESRQAPTAPLSAAAAGPIRPSASGRRVLLLSGYGQNDAITGLLGEYEVLLRGAGFDVKLWNLSTPGLDLAPLLAALQSGEVAFALSYLGIGCDIRLAGEGAGAGEIVWDHFGVPVLKLNGDIPAYFPARHEATPRASANIYYAREFQHYADRWLGADGHAPPLNVFRTPFPISCIERASVDRVRRRKGKLVFLKNGNSPQGLVQLWEQSLPSAVVTLLLELCEELRDDCLGGAVVFLDDLVLNALAKRGYSQAVPSRLMHLLVAQIDDYFRRVKSLMIAKALLDFPVVVQGNNWEHLDFRGRRATLLPGADFTQSLDVYAHQLGVIDMSPNIGSAPHDRVTRSAGMYALCVTNRQQWLIESFPGFDRLAFGFSEESIQARVADILRSPDEYLDLALSFGDRCREIWQGERVVAKLVEVAGIVATLHSRGTVRLQPYFAW